MARLFFSFLGTSPDVPCGYSLGERSIRQSASFRRQCCTSRAKSWSGDDKVVIGCTAEARERNLPYWARENRRTNGDPRCRGLRGHGDCRDTILN